MLNKCDIENKIDQTDNLNKTRQNKTRHDKAKPNENLDKSIESKRFAAKISFIFEVKLA